MLIKNGHKYCTQNITVLNEAPNGNGITVPNVKVVLQIPAGLVYDSSILPPDMGSYNPETFTWTIPVLAPNMPISGYFCFTVVDNCEFPFKLYYSVSSAEIQETNQEDNSTCIEFGNPEDIPLCAIIAAMAEQAGTLTCEDLGFPNEECPECPEANLSTDTN